jgi:hypothetical protein
MRISKTPNHRTSNKTKPYGVKPEIKIRRHKSLSGQMSFDFERGENDDDYLERQRQLQMRGHTELMEHIDKSIQEAKPFDECLDDPIRDDLPNQGIAL